ncbi:MAG: hypothetical protein V1884_04320 [Candidatus Omnitrophota bacterium]
MNKIKRVLNQLKINANLIQRIYAGFNRDGSVKVNIKNVAEIIKVGIMLCLCLARMIKVMNKNAAPIVIPNRLSDFLSNFN